MDELGLGFIIGIIAIGMRILWCHFDAKKENEKIKKGI